MRSQQQYRKQSSKLEGSGDCQTKIVQCLEGLIKVPYEAAVKGIRL